MAALEKDKKRYARSVKWADDWEEGESKTPEGLRDCEEQYVPTVCSIRYDRDRE